MSRVYQCNNNHCSVCLFKKPISHKSQLCCPVCRKQDIQQTEFIEGTDEFRCSNPQCTEYQINPMIDENTVFICPFCRSKNIDIIKHDIVR